MKSTAEKPRDSLQNFHPKTPQQFTERKTPKKSEKMCVIELPLNEENYLIKIRVTDASKLSMNCSSKEGFTSAYNYSIVVSYEEFCEMGKTFKLCDNIYEVFNTLKNIFEEISFSSTSIKEMKSNARLIQSDNDAICLLIKIPLISGKYEEIKITFKKAKKDIILFFIYLKKKINSDVKTIAKIIVQIVVTFKTDIPPKIFKIGNKK